jgi:hypothetical protein
VSAWPSGQRGCSSISGRGQRESWETYPPLIAIPLGAAGGAGFIGDGVADAATIAELKGQHMLIDTNASLFDALPPAAAA